MRRDIAEYIEIFYNRSSERQNWGYWSLQFIKQKFYAWRVAA